MSFVQEVIHKATSILINSEVYSGYRDESLARFKVIPRKITLVKTLFLFDVIAVLNIFFFFLNRIMVYFSLNYFFSMSLSESNMKERRMKDRGALRHSV